MRDRCEMFPSGVIKHFDVFKAWVDGAEVQIKTPNGDWVTFNHDENPVWGVKSEYRVKPKVVKMNLIKFTDTSDGEVWYEVSAANNQNSYASTSITTTILYTFEHQE